MEALRTCWTSRINEEGQGDAAGWLIVSAVASVIAALLLMRFVPASEFDADGSNKSARHALILGALSWRSSRQRVVG